LPRILAVGVGHDDVVRPARGRGADRDGSAQGSGGNERHGIDRDVFGMVASGESDSRNRRSPFNKGIARAVEDVVVRLGSQVMLRLVFVSRRDERSGRLNEPVLIKVCWPSGFITMN